MFRDGYFEAVAAYSEQSILDNQFNKTRIFRRNDPS